MIHETKALLIVTAGWHLACLAMMFMYRQLIGPLVVIAYTAYFGDVQASYGTFERVATDLAMMIITSPATLVSLLLFDRLHHRAVHWKWRMAAFCGWEVLVVNVLIWSYKVSFPYMINQLGWARSGRRRNVDSFRNLVLHRIIAGCFGQPQSPWWHCGVFHSGRGKPTGTRCTAAPLEHPIPSVILHAGP